MDIYGLYTAYNPQESLENTININKYHGGTPNCPLKINIWKNSWNPTPELVAGSSTSALAPRNAFALAF